jgi:molecular chaperone GrpE
MQNAENMTDTSRDVDDTDLNQQTEQSDAASSTEQVEDFDPMAELAAVQQQAAQHWDSLLRLQAEMENLRRRSRIDVENAHKYGVEKLLHALVPVADSLEFGLEAATKPEASLDSIREGVEMTFKQFLDVLADFNVERINPAGEKFDPQKHEAMTMIPSPDHESNSVVEVFQKGYALNERLIRPARVIVAQ